MLNDSNLISRVHNGLVFDRVYMEVRHSLLYYVLLLICSASVYDASMLLSSHLLCAHQYTCVL